MFSGFTSEVNYLISNSWTLKTLELLVSRPPWGTQTKIVSIRNGAQMSGWHSGIRPLPSQMVTRISLLMEVAWRWPPSWSITIIGDLICRDSGQDSGGWFYTTFLIFERYGVKHNFKDQYSGLVVDCHRCTKENYKLGSLGLTGNPESLFGNMDRNAFYKSYPKSYKGNRNRNMK